MYADPHATTRCHDVASEPEQAARKHQPAMRHVPFAWSVMSHANVLTSVKRRAACLYFLLSMAARPAAHRSFAITAASSYKEAPLHVTVTPPARTEQQSCRGAMQTRALCAATPPIMPKAMMVLGHRRALEIHKSLVMQTGFARPKARTATSGVCSAFWT